MPKEINIFKKPYEGHTKEHCPTGQPIENIYSYEIDSYGRKILKKTGETNLYEKIQASLEETKIENILARATAGDTSMLRPDGIYADLTEMPNNLLEARKAMQKLENTWNGLPNEIKEKYNYSLDEYIGKSGSESWLRDMGLLQSKEVETKQATASESAVGQEETNE